ncbi:MAG: hypothetical protein ACRCV3_05380 [Desulfovibrionaceae bacterium]
MKKCFPQKILFFILFLISFSSCGYVPTHRLSSILGDDKPSILITHTSNATLITSLPQYLRSALYGEIENRDVATFTYSPPSNYEMTIDIVSYRSTARSKTEDDIILLYEITLVLLVKIYSSSTGKLFWSSGNFGTSHTYDTFAEEIVLTDIAKRSTERLVDMMQLSF